jgi:ABC-type transport system involved in multi-copper enzyme maturation permease subunit
VKLLLKLMKLEVRRIPLTVYIKASVVASLFLLCFLYFASYVASSTRDAQFQHYDNILLLATILYMMIFCILAAVMYTKYVVQEYGSKQLFLLFSYPIERKKVALSKLAVVTGFITLAMIIGYIPPLVLYGLTELWTPIVRDVMSLQFVLSSLKLLAIMVISVNGISLIAMRIGFIKKSVPTTIVTSFVLFGVIGNAVIGSFNNDKALIGLSVLIMSVAALFAYSLLQVVHQMELE